MEVKVVSWADPSNREALRDIRQRVFIEEQGISQQQEWDELDAQAIHFIALDGIRPVGCARLFRDGHFGRMAILAEHRGQHWGSRLLRATEDYYQRECHGQLLKASVQAQAYNFYRRNGFVPEVEFFWDAGISHLSMSKVLGRDCSPASCLFESGVDSEVYQLEHEAAIEGLFQIGCQNKPTHLMLNVGQLQHPVWSSPASLNSIKRYILSSPRRNVQILIKAEYPGISEHPLIQLSHRMSSRIQIKVHSGLACNGALYDPYGYLIVTGPRVNTCFNDRPAVARHKEQFEALWRSAQPTLEARSLHL